MSRGFSTILKDSGSVRVGAPKCPLFRVPGVRAAKRLFIFPRSLGSTPGLLCAERSGQHFPCRILYEKEGKARAQWQSGFPRQLV